MKRTAASAAPHSGRSMKTAWVVSIAILSVGVTGQYLLLAAFDAATPAMVFAALVLVAVGAIAAYLAPRKKLLVGAGIAVPAAILFGVADTLVGLMGLYTKWPGPLNSLLFAIVALPIGLVLASIGALVGAKLAGARPDQPPSS